MLQFGACGRRAMRGFLAMGMVVLEIWLKRSRCCRGVGRCIGFSYILVCFMNGFGIRQNVAFGSGVAGVAYCSAVVSMFEAGSCAGCWVRLLRFCAVIIAGCCGSVAGWPLHAGGFLSFCLCCSLV